MNDQEDFGDERKPGGPAGSDDVARLLRAAGPRPAVAGERSARVRAAVHEHWRYSVAARRRTRRFAFAAAVPLAAAMVWAVLVATGVWETMRVTPPSTAIATMERSEGPVAWPGRTPPAAGAPLQPGTSVETGASGRVALRLRNGASVRLDAGTRARLLPEALVRLDRGGVYVDTGGDGANRSVTVRTPLGTVRDIGTQFQVRASADEVRLSVRRGAAVLEHRGASHDAPSGTALTLGGDGLVTRRAVTSSDPEWDWVQDAAPPFSIEGRVLENYLDWIESETGLRIGYADPSILVDATTVVLHGSVEGLRPDETLDAVLPTCGLRHRVDGEMLIIERAEPGARD